jgi:hypothetical protein
MSRIQEEFAQSAALLIQQAAALGYTVALGEAWRTPEQVAWDVAHGTGDAHSLHPERLAIDLAFFREKVYITDGSQLSDIGAWWKSQQLPADVLEQWPKAGYRWGGDFTTRPDGNHFSITPDGLEA